MPLTEIACRNAKPREKQYKLADANGLYLLVHPNGSKYWRWKYRFLGKEKLLAFGVYPEIPLADAREQREQARKALRLGSDPSAAKKQLRLVAHVKAGNTFEAVAREWHRAKCADWIADHAARILRSLEADVFPHIGSRPIAEITAPEILAVVRLVEKRDALDIAGRVLQRISAVIRYGIVTGRADRNPALDLRGALTSPEITNRRSLPIADMPDFLRGLSKYRGGDLTRLAMRFHILTFQRPGELRGALWSEIDTEAALWRIPAERMKMKLDQVVPLSRQAIGVIEELRAISGARPHIFPNQHTPKKVMSENTLGRCIELLGYRDKATAHGFRTTASTWLNEAGYPSDWIERQLAHVPQNKVRAAYNRAQWLDQRRTMMQTWADALDAMEAGGNVTQGQFRGLRVA